MDLQIAKLDSFDFWSVKVHNGRGTKRYDCTIKHNGCRVTAIRPTSDDAIEVALHRIRERLGLNLRIARATKGGSE